MATNANEILDRLADLLDAATQGPWTVGEHGKHVTVCISTCARMSTLGSDIAAIVAIRNAAPALIRLARAAIAMYGSAESGDATEAEVAVIGKQIEDGIKALGEVRL